MSHQPHILVIDDEPQILRAIRTILTEKQFRVSTASRGEEGLALAASTQPDLVILDLGLPDMDGVEVCTRLREWTQMPIIILSVRDSERDKVAALDRGADDYLTKPFGIEELLARVRVALRHSAQKGNLENKVVRAGPITIDLAWHVVKRGDEEIKLTGTEYKLLAYLAATGQSHAPPMIGRYQAGQAYLVVRGASLGSSPIARICGPISSSGCTHS